ncbi:GIY-YIG nuclease family protein [Catenovulum sediminis]|uniref:GIY-YIG nuclease family protein n=1 Tax=Catenovulum sediminis TaxID=1740262 RepID=A0ABV1RLC6_9ALTE|nr:GIY-YIG nuclease family protein [Catenovulum sediminis]
MQNNCWYVYLIRTNDNALYTGITTDPQRRFKEHQIDIQKQAKYFRSRQAKTLEFFQFIGNRSQASQIEYQIKKLPKQKKEKIIKQGSLEGIIVSDHT